MLIYACTIKTLRSLMGKNTTNWVAVASAEQVRVGDAQGFMQVSHGKLSPLKRIQAGDHVTYYSPSVLVRKKDGLQSFSAIGAVRGGDPYQGAMTDGSFHPLRSDVNRQNANGAPIRTLLDQLSFTSGKQNWGGSNAIWLARD